MRWIPTFFCLIVLLIAAPIHAQESEWTAWGTTTLNDEWVVIGVRSDGTTAAQIKPPLPEDYAHVNFLRISYTGDYLAYYVHEAGFPQEWTKSAVVVYDVANETFPVIFPMPDYYWNSGTLVFDEAESHFSLSYNFADPVTNWPTGWAIHVFDLQTGEVAAELIVQDEETDPGSIERTPFVRRFVGDEITFHLTNTQNEDYARPLKWNIQTGTLDYDPAFAYFWFDYFQPTGEVVYGRFDERFPVLEEGSGEGPPINYFYAPNSLWIAESGSEGHPFFTTPDWWTSRPTFIQNGERVLSGGYIRGGASGSVIYIINRDGTVMGEYIPRDEQYLDDLTFAGTPDGFVQLNRHALTLLHVNTRGETPVAMSVRHFLQPFTLSHIQFDGSAEDRGTWADITPSEN